MFEDDITLSSDLVWMLQSAPVDEDVLIEILVDKYYQEIYLLALSRLIYPEEAHRAAQESLIQIISQKNDYRGETTVAVWLGSIANKVIGARRTNQVNLSLLNPNLINTIRDQQSGNILSDFPLQNATKELKSGLRAMRSSRLKWARFQKII